jgi:hypothetical protein
MELHDKEKRNLNLKFLLNYNEFNNIDLLVNQKLN